MLLRPQCDFHLSKMMAENELRLDEGLACRVKRVDRGPQQTYWRIFKIYFCHSSLIGSAVVAFISLKATVEFIS